MTEYEIADLALSTQEGIRQQVGLVQGQASIALASLSVYFSLIFGYLLVAYFVGANLTPAQNVILTLLYLSTIILNRSAFLAIQLGGAILNKGLMELNPDARQIFLYTDSGIVVTIVVSAALMGATLYFMWSIRHPRQSDQLAQ
jgi:hypothetical protein